jgi:hypothetical protein
MNNNQRSSGNTHSEKNEPILLFLMFRVSKETGVGIIERALRLLEPDSVLRSIALIFSLIPIEPNHI